MSYQSNIVRANPDAVLTLQLAKSHLNIEEDFTAHDDLITMQIAAAQEYAEEYTGVAIGKQSLVMKGCKFEDVVITASLNDTLVKVEYCPSDGDAIAELDASFYRFRSFGPGTNELKFKGTLPAIADRDDAVVVTIDRGFSPEDCPAKIKQAMLLLVGDMYERREDRGEIGYNSAVHALLRAYRRY